MKAILVWCCGCHKAVSPRLTTGQEIYPARPDLAHLPFWKCDDCRNYVGCHHKTANRLQPLGNIPTAELRAARRKIHEVLDPLWQAHGMPRKKLYSRLSKLLGWKYHTAELRTMQEARAAWLAVRQIERDWLKKETA